MSQDGTKFPKLKFDRSFRQLHRRPHFESLETRRLLAFSLVETPGSVEFVGDNSPNSLVLRVRGDRVEYSANNESFRMLDLARTTTISSFRIVGGSAHDRIDASELYSALRVMFDSNSGVLIEGGGGDDTLIGSDLNDRIIGGSGKDTIQANGGDDYIDVFDWEADSVDGGLGVDSVKFESFDASPVQCEYWNPFQKTNDNLKHRVKVLVLNYDPLVPSEGGKPLHQVFGWTDPSFHAAAYEEAFERTSGGFIDFEITRWENINAIPVKKDGFVYGVEEYVNLLRSGGPWHQPDLVDYVKLLADNGVSELIDAGIVDEVWCPGAPYFGFFESAMMGPGSFWINGATYPEVPSSRAFVVQPIGYERFVDVLMHGTGHRTESTMQRIYGGWNLSNPQTNWDKFAANAHQSNGLSGVGTAHFPANGQSHYDYANVRTVESNADDFLDYPDLDYVKRPISREAWGRLGATEFYNGDDYQQDYFQWFYTRFPRAPGWNTDGRANNWWKYLYDFNNYSSTGQALPLRVHSVKVTDVVNLGSNTQTFSVAYAGAVPIAVSSIDNSDVTVQGPNAATYPARLVNLSDSTDGTYRVATYQMDAPGGSWDSADFGLYYINLANNQIQNTLGESLLAQQIGVFAVRNTNKRALDNDSGTSFLLRFDNSLTGEAGETPLSSNSISYGEGVINQQGVFAAGGFARYLVGGNISPVAGTVEFWVNPLWNASETGPNDHRDFLRVDLSPSGLCIYFDSWDDSIRLGIAGDNPNTSVVESNYYQSVSTGTIKWKRNEWHHVAASWDSATNSMAIYLDGRLYDIKYSAPRINSFSSANFTIGGSSGQSAGSGFDEYRISSVARSASEITANYRLGFDILRLSAVESSIAMAIGDRRRLTAYADTSLGSRQDVSDLVLVTSSNEEVVRVGADKSIMALKSGNAQITLRYGSLSSSIAVTVADLQRPFISSVTAPAVNQRGNTSYEFQVQYSDDQSIATSWIDRSDILVQGPNGYSRFADLASVTSNSSGNLLTATYRFTPPGGDWDKRDDGSYFLTLAALQVRDGTGQFAASKAIGNFSVKINNEPPTLDVIPDIVLLEDAGTKMVQLSGITAGFGESQPLRVFASSSNTELVPSPTVNYSSPNTLGSLSFTPASDKSGIAVATVTVEDGGIDGNLSTPNDNGNFSRSFTITISPVNDPPSNINLSKTAIAENLGVNAEVGILSTTDVDIGDTFTYTLIAGVGDTNNNAFNISGSRLRANISFNFETKSSYTIRIRSTDKGGLSVERAFTITVIDVNEAPTNLTLSSSTLSENAGANTTVGMLSTTDPDAGNTFIYTLVSGTGSTDNATFNISGSTLRATISFDFETKSSYTVRIRSTDQGGLFFEKAFSITVTNANEAPTNLTLSSSTIAENAGANASVGTLSTTDPDAGNTFTYVLVSGIGDVDNAAFNISGTTLRATSSFDFETKSSYTVRIRSTDQGGLFFEKAFTINVTNVNEAPTNLTLSSSTIAENAGTNASVGTLSTTDPDAGNTFVYTLVSGTGSTDNTAFNISGSTLRATNSFDFETKSSYTVRIRSTDQGGLLFEKTFTINVTNANEVPTDITLSSSTIAENAGPNATVGTLSTTDPDAGNTFIYTLVSGTGSEDNSAFNINGTALRATNSLNFETKSSHTVRIRSTDQGGLFFEKSFSITVTNANELPTDIALSSTTIAENAGTNATVGTLSTIDPDAGNTFSYTLVSGAGDGDNAAFNISGSTLRATSSLDFESKSSYTIRVRTTDQNGLFLEKSFVITVTNVNEAPTEINLSSTMIVENAGANAIVGTLSTADPDASNTFTYAFVSGSGDADNAAFNISGSTLRATDSFDFETKSSYTVRIRSTDQGALLFEKTFTINVTNANEVPTDITLSSSTIAENAGPNATLGTLSTVDPDVGNTFTYTLVSGTGDADNGAFNLIGSMLRATNSFDFETKSNYTVRIRSTDQGGLFFEKAFSITVKNANEVPTDITLSSSTIAENAGANATVGTLSTADPDAGNTFVYTLVAGTGGTDNAAFNISGSTLRATNNFDFETKSIYTVRIRSTDQGGLFVERTFMITVTDINDSPTNINLSSTEIAENAEANASVGVLSTTDSDTGNTFTYELISGAGDTDNSFFNISGSNLRASNSLDFETKKNYSIRIRSTDQGGLFFEKAFVITVTDTNDAPTNINLSSTSIAENAGPNATVGMLSTTDPDASNAFTYTLVAGAESTDNSSFNISGSTLRATNSFDFETKPNYTVRIRSTDQGGLFFEKAFTITVTDVNEVPTNITLSSTTIAENAGANATVGTLSTTDPDVGNTFTYTFVSGAGDADNAAFNIVGSTLRATNSYDFETKSSYTIRVRTTDQNGLFFEKSFVITVTNVNEAPTDISLSSAMIAENVGPNATVGTLSTSDVDAVNTFTYALVAGSGDTDNGSFKIVSNTLRATNSFDFESKSSYTIRVRTTDQNGLFFEKSFLIAVTNVNEAPTDISLSSTMIAENAGPNATVGTLLTSDVDAANTFTYALVAGIGNTDNGSFNIIGNTLRATNSIDFETKSSYTIRVRTTDQNGLFFEKAFVISVVDVNDPPIALPDTYLIPAGTSQVLNVVDNDTDVDNAIDRSSIEIVRSPINGIAIPISDGTIRYTPNTGYQGVEVFTYRVKDAVGLFSNEATVTLRVNSAPIANADSIVAKPGVTTTLDVLSNDTDPDGTINPATVSIVTSPSMADVTVQPNGQILFTPRNGFLGTTRFQYVVSDNDGRTSNPADVTVLVTGALYQNPTVKFDVDDDRSISPLDVLVIINLLNAQGPSIPVDGLPGPPDYVDVNGDNRVDPMDVLEVINFINSRNSGGGEGEGESVFTNLLPAEIDTSLRNSSIAREASNTAERVYKPSLQRDLSSGLVGGLSLNGNRLDAGRLTSVKQSTADTNGELDPDELFEEEVFGFEDLVDQALAELFGKRSR